MDHLRHIPPNRQAQAGFTMSISRRIYVSMPGDHWLDAQQNELKWGIVGAIERMGYVTEIFFDPRGASGEASLRAWGPDAAERVARKCVGMAILGFPRWNVRTDEGEGALATEFSNYEGAVAYTLGLPMLVLAQKGLIQRGVFEYSYGGYVASFPADADSSWLNSREFGVALDYWKRQLEQRRDVFLGYSSGSAGTASNLKRFLRADLGATVLDWQTDFAATGRISQHIEKAARRCTAGIFLFTKDDAPTNDSEDQFVPRDNVVFEAGYFMSAKGYDNVLIIREDGAKLLDDLGGHVYAPLADRSDIRPIERMVRKFIAEI